MFCTKMSKFMEWYMFNLHIILGCAKMITKIQVNDFPDRGDVYGK